VVAQLVDGKLGRFRVDVSLRPPGVLASHAIEQLLVGGGHRPRG
jgi:hypothetical protein